MKAPELCNLKRKLLGNRKKRKHIHIAAKTATPVWKPQRDLLPKSMPFFWPQSVLVQSQKLSALRKHWCTYICICVCAHAQACSWASQNKSTAAKNNIKTKCSKCDKARKQQRKFLENNDKKRRKRRGVFDFFELFWTFF